ncbi:MAG: LysM peptidoglycan-binding domain-containing protein [Lactobacillus sp.]
MSNEPKLHHYERPTESRISERRYRQHPATEQVSKHSQGKRGHHASIWAGILIVAILMIALFPLVRTRTDHSNSQDLASSKPRSTKAVAPRKSKQVQSKAKKTTPKQTTKQTNQTSQSQTKQTSQKNQATYVVKSGDTLFSIAQAHGTTVDKLVQLNGLSGPNAIKAGQTLKMR